MKVEAVQPHSNEFGVRDNEASYDKKKGDVYNIPDEREAQHLIDQGFVKKAKTDGGSDSKG